MILQKSLLYADLVLKKHLLISMLKSALLNIFVKTLYIHLFQDSLIIVLMNKSIHHFLIDPKHLNSSEKNQLSSI